MDPARRADAIEWLAEHAHENLGTEMALRSAADGPLDVAFAHHDGTLAGVSVSSAGGQWFLEAAGPDAVLELVASVLAPEGPGWPSKVTASGRVKAWLRPLLEREAVILREHD
ncbi:MAG TPA: hypothetical protein VGL92_19040, partial [Acidimicrobiia bacterium]